MCTYTICEVVPNRMAPIGSHQNWSRYSDQMLSVADKDYLWIRLNQKTKVYAQDL